MEALLERVKRLQSYDGTAFLDIVVTGTGFTGKDRKFLRKLCSQTGIRYCGDLVSGWTTHLVLNDTVASGCTGAKIRVAAEWCIPIVRLSWLLDSIKHGEVLPEDAYEILIAAETRVEQPPPPAAAVAEHQQRPKALLTDQNSKNRSSKQDSNSPLQHTPPPSARRPPFFDVANVTEQLQGLMSPNNCKGFSVTPMLLMQPSQFTSAGETPSSGASQRHKNAPCSVPSELAIIRCFSSPKMDVSPTCECENEEHDDEEIVRSSPFDDTVDDAIPSSTAFPEDNEEVDGADDEEADEAEVTEIENEPQPPPPQLQHQEEDKVSEWWDDGEDDPSCAAARSPSQQPRPSAAAIEDEPSSSSHFLQTQQDQQQQQQLSLCSPRRSTGTESSSSPQQQPSLSLFSHHQNQQQQSPQWWDEQDPCWVPASQPRDFPSPLGRESTPQEEEEESEFSFGVAAAAPEAAAAASAPCFQHLHHHTATETTPLGIERPVTATTARVAESPRMMMTMASVLRGAATPNEIIIDNEVALPSPPSSPKSYEASSNDTPLLDTDAGFESDCSSPPAAQIQHCCGRDPGEECSPSSSECSNPSPLVVARARAPLPPLPPLPSGLKEPADDTVVIKMMQRAPRGSSVKAVYRLPNTKDVCFAEEVHLRKKKLTLSIKDKQRAVVLAPLDDDDDDDGLLLVEPLSFYKILGEDWHMEYYRLYTGTQAAALAAAAGVRLHLPPGFDSSVELLRGTTREHIDLRRAQNVVPVRKAKMGVSTLRTRGTGGGSVSYFWRCELEVQGDTVAVLLPPS